MTYQWYAGDNDEIYRYGPFETRQEAIDEAIGNTEHGDTIFVIEAYTQPLYIDAERVLEALLDDSADLYGEETEPDRIGSKQAIEAADAELQALLDAWMDKHRHTFTEPTQFQGSRNADSFPRPDDEAQTND